jgi:hypothetical protein
VVVARAPAEELASGARALGATLVYGSYRDESVLRAAGVPAAGALVVTEDDDVGNLHAALAAQDLNADLRIRLRLFNQELGRRVQELFRDCQVFDAAALAVPAFVSAALQRDWQQRIVVGGRTLVVRRWSVAEPGVLLPLARQPSSACGSMPVAGRWPNCNATAPWPTWTRSGSATCTPTHAPTCHWRCGCCLAALSAARRCRSWDRVAGRPGWRPLWTSRWPRWPASWRSSSSAMASRHALGAWPWRRWPLRTASRPMGSAPVSRAAPWRTPPTPGRARALGRLADHCDLLLCEAGTATPRPDAIHLTAEQAGELAATSGARRLVLTHLPPGHRPGPDVPGGRGIAWRRGRSRHARMEVRAVPPMQ